MKSILIVWATGVVGAASLARVPAAQTDSPFTTLNLPYYTGEVFLPPGTGSGTTA